MSRPRAGARSSMVMLALAATVLLAGAGLWLRALVGPVWPSILADWSLGSALLALSAGGVGALLVIRVPRNVVGWLFLAEGLLSGIVFVLRQYTTLVLAGGGDAAAVWTAWAFAWVIPLNMTTLSLLLLLFPFGHVPSPRWRPVVVVICVVGIAAAAAAMFSPYVQDQTPFAQLTNPAVLLEGEAGLTAVRVTSETILLGLLAAVVGLIVRVRRSRGAERQQMKWFLYAAVVAVVTFIIGFWVPPLFVVATLLALPGVPVAAAVAILRYRLYEIDRVINRTVVYSAATAVLAVAYLLTVTGLRVLTEPITGDTALAVAASTLAVAALFQPVRTRTQRAVDRRFNRARYDASATIEHVRQRLRDEVDLESLRSELIGVICATMQPATTTLWLRETKR